MEDLLVALRAVVALAAVLGLLLFLSRRLQRSQTRGTSPLSELLPKKLVTLARSRPSRPAAVSRPRPDKISVVARSGLGGKAQLVVAEFGGIRYVLGVTEHGVNVVDTQEAPVFEDEADSETVSTVDDPPDDIVDRALRSVA